MSRINHGTEVGVDSVGSRAELVAEGLVAEGLVAERMASLKVGILSGSVTGLLWVGLLGLTLQLQLSDDGSPQSAPPLTQILISATIAGFSGFLFGITYRHVIRQDDMRQDDMRQDDMRQDDMRQDDSNSSATSPATMDMAHLKSGAVGAFGLVRGLAQIQLASFDWHTIVNAGITLGASLLLFALARICLDIGFDRGWLQRFPIGKG
jgi:hypothetical protein